MHGAGTALIGVDDTPSAKIYAATQAATPVSVVQNLADGISAPEGILRVTQAGRVVDEIDLRDMPALKGRHNWQNACMAYGAAKALGLSSEKIAAAMLSFPGLAHRMQQIAHLANVAFVNDSKATNADAAEKALASYDNIYWIAGGIAKAGGIQPLIPYFNRISKAYLIGAAAADFAASLKGRVNFEISVTLEVAVANAARDAAQSLKPKPVVLLSPACASFDQYKNFELRGDAFAAYVAKLPGIIMAKGDQQ